MLTTREVVCCRVTMGSTAFGFLHDHADSTPAATLMSCILVTMGSTAFGFLHGHADSTPAATGWTACTWVAMNSIALRLD